MIFKYSSVNAAEPELVAEVSDGISFFNDGILDTECNFQHVQQLRCLYPYYIRHLEDRRKWSRQDCCRLYYGHTY